VRRLFIFVAFVASGCTIGPLATDRSVEVRNAAGRPYLSARYRSLCQPEVVAGIDADCLVLQAAINKLVDDDELAKTVRALGSFLPEQKSELKQDLVTARRALATVKKKAGL
jgi:hypothetical protein